MDTAAIRPVRYGFSLVELAIVLVILGLLVGGVLTGKALIRAAEIRSQIVQIDEYRLAANTFKEKYFYWPGDIPDPVATQLGLVARYVDGFATGQGSNGDGVIGNNGVSCASNGETILFWVDLSTKGLIRGKLSKTSPVAGNIQNFTVTGDAIAAYTPPARIGNSHYITLWSGGVYPSNPASGASYNAGDNKHYFTLAQQTQLAGSNFNPCSIRVPGMQVSTAYSIDAKVDDGMPMLGAVIAAYIHNRGKAYWAGDFGPWGGQNRPHTTAVSGSATTCYDNNNTAGQPQRYSLSYGDGMNCALTLKAF